MGQRQWQLSLQFLKEIMEVSKISQSTKSHTLQKKLFYLLRLIRFIL